MKRDLQRLATARFDAIVAGGGVYGLTIAHELARRGMTICLVERDDFAAATSFNSLKTLHGGIRELQQGAVSRVREFVRERREIARLAPHLVRVLPFVVPTSRRHPRTLMRAFLTAYDLLARDRNEGVDTARRLPASRTISRAECLDLNPLIDPRGVTGGALWHDYQLHSPERFAIALVESMVRREAAAINYTEVLGLLRSGGGAVSGVRVRDRLTGESLDVQSPIVINAAGPWAAGILDRSGAKLPDGQRPAWSLAMNLVVDVPALQAAVGGLASGRFLFLVPWGQGSIAGTSHDPGPPEGGAPSITERNVEAFLSEVKTAFPSARLSRERIRLVHRGLLPAPPGTHHGSALLKASVIHDHAPDGTPGLLTVVGTRYTTAGATARAVAERVARSARSTAAARAVTPLPAGDVGDLDQFIRSETSASGAADATLMQRLVVSYGKGFKDVRRLMLDQPALGAPLGPGCPVTGAEVLHAVRSEMAMTLSDALIRRTGAGAGGHPGDAVARAAASVMGAELGWSAEQVESEIAAVDAFYRVPPAA